MAEPRIPTMIEAIAAHKTAWHAFQNAADDEAMQAEDEEGYALDAVLTLLPRDLDEVIALKAHLDWYVEEERQRFHDGPPEPTNVSNYPFAVHAALGIVLAAVGEAERQRDAAVAGGIEVAKTFNRQQLRLETAEAVTRAAQALVDAVAFDDHGAVIAGAYKGGNGGLLSNATIKAADALRTELLAWKAGADASGAPGGPSARCPETLRAGGDFGAPVAANVPPAGWRPMSTAPRDGSNILLLLGEFRPDLPDIRVGSYVSAETAAADLGEKGPTWLIWDSDVEWWCEQSPLCWMPIPTPVTGTGGGNG